MLLDVVVAEEVGVVNLSCNLVVVVVSCRWSVLFGFFEVVIEVSSCVVVVVVVFVVVVVLVLFSALDDAAG